MRSERSKRWVESKALARPPDFDRREQRGLVLAAYETVVVVRRQSGACGDSTIRRSTSRGLDARNGEPADDTDADRHLFVVYNLRGPEPRVRVISARDMTPHDESTSMSEHESLREIPEFGSEDEEREFWANRDSTAYVDWRRARAATFPNLKPSTKLEDA